MMKSHLLRFAMMLGTERRAVRGRQVRVPPDCAGNGVCVDLLKDSKHCGACGNACAGGDACKGGRSMP